MLYAIEIKTKELRIFLDENEARNSGNGFITFTSPEELCSNPNVNGPFLVSVYNAAFSSEKDHVKKFSDRISGAKRVFKLFELKKIKGKTPADEGRRAAIKDDIQEEDPLLELSRNLTSAVQKLSKKRKILTSQPQLNKMVKDFEALDIKMEYDRKEKMWRFSKSGVSKTLLKSNELPQVREDISAFVKRNF